jgi:hypothetical protein
MKFLRLLVQRRKAAYLTYKHLKPVVVEIERNWRAPGHGLHIYLSERRIDGLLESFRLIESVTVTERRVRNVRLFQRLRRLLHPGIRLASDAQRRNSDTTDLS